MKKSLDFKIERPARKKGSDRYEAIEDDSFKIYVPQSICRKDGVPVPKILITFESK